MKHNRATLLCALAALAAACADEGATPDYGPGQTTSQDSPATSAKATRGKAEAIARLFTPYRATDESGRSSRTNGWYALEGGNRMTEKTPSASMRISSGRNTELFSWGLKTEA